MITKKIKDRFYSKVKKTKTCWEWQGFVDRLGYGHFWFNKGMPGSHRVSWQIHKGNIPKDLHVLHSCDNRKCVNPSHLFLGTQKDNVQDMIQKNRTNYSCGDNHYLRKNPEQMYGEKNNSAKLSEKAVIWIRELAKNRPDLTYKKLGEEFNISPSAIYLIVKRKRWKHI